MPNALSVLVKSERMFCDSPDRVSFCSSTEVEVTGQCVGRQTIAVEISLINSLIVVGWHYYARAVRLASRSRRIFLRLMFTTIKHTTPNGILPTNGLAKKGKMENRPSRLRKTGFAAAQARKARFATRDTRLLTKVYRGNIVLYASLTAVDTD